MKKVILLALVLSVLLVGCAPALAQFVQLNDQLRVFIVAGVVALVGWVFIQLTNMWPWFGQFFGKYQEEVAVALSGVVVGLVQTWLNLIPPEWEDVGVIAQVLIVAVLMAIAAIRMLGKRGVKGIRAA